MAVCVAIFAHQEERRIAACLASLPLERTDTQFHILVNGSSDRTAAISRDIAARHPQVIVHDLHPGGKSRTWNRYIFELAPQAADCWIFMDGDAEIAPGSLDALVQILADTPHAHAAAGLPRNGRSYLSYQNMLRAEGGLFGDLYALSGRFVERMRAANIRLPDDLIGDDGLLAAMAMTDLKNEDHWDKNRIAICEDAGFFCEPTRLSQPDSWKVQYKRMINYSVRHFQNRIISDIMRDTGPVGLPARLSDLYPVSLPRFRPRLHPANWWFDRQALKRMRRAIV